MRPPLMHGAAITGPHLAADLIGFSAGLVITVLLLVLTLRAARLPGTPFANIFLALCALTWNLGGLAHTVALTSGMPKAARPALMASAIQFTAAAAWPIAILAIWRPFAVLPWQQHGYRLLQLAAIVDAAIIVFSLWSPALLGTRLLPIETLKEFASYSGSALALGAVMLLRGPLTSGAVWFASLTMLFGVFGTTLTLAVASLFDLSAEVTATLGVVSKQSTLLIVLGAFFLFARFRFADVFIRHSLRILLAGLLAVVLVLIFDAPWLSQLANQTASPLAVRVFGGSVLATTLLLSFALLDRGIGTLVNRWIVHAPDYRHATRQLGETLRRLHLEREIADAAKDAARHTLELDDVRSIAFSRLPGSLWPAEIHDGEVVELDASSPLRHLLSLPDLELLVPVRVGGQTSSVLAISPGRARRGLVTHEVSYLRTVAAQVGSRLDSLQLEREMVERRNRESLLLQQLTEAELRALRAQINPHFLFNSLNTIADLIVTNPSGAEATTLRLAKVFRHVLAQSSRPLISIGDEVEFLRAYLHIEEARFGGRLHVDIDVPADVALHRIPSLLLQPLVENALKHGLAPKPGAGHLWVSARAQGEHVCLRVEDDGVGLPAIALAKTNGAHAMPPVTVSSRESPGVGLMNVTERLAVLYQGQASVNVESREAGGVRVTVLVPRDHGLADA
jgi:two-component system LytT family sensor kinase